MAVYDDDAVAANAWRHLQMAARHADQNEIPDAAQRLSSAIDEGAKWFVSRYRPDITGLRVGPTAGAFRLSLDTRR